jgi:predicted ATPase with chaperone activity
MGNLEDTLLARLARMRSKPDAGDEDWNGLAASPPVESSSSQPAQSGAERPTFESANSGRPASPEQVPNTRPARSSNVNSANVSSDSKLDNILDRLSRLADGGDAEPEPSGGRPNTPNKFPKDSYLPLQKASLRDMDLSESGVEELILKYLLNRGDGSGRAVSAQIRLPFLILEPLLRKMKADQLVVYRGAAQMNDYVYQLTEIGRDRAKRLVEHSTYFGSAPVSLHEYVDSIQAQSLKHQNPSPADLKSAFSDLLISPTMLRRLGPAINSGRGMFLFGQPGNGKTSIAKRVTRAFGNTIWVPRAIGVDGEIIRLFDPMNHEEVPLKPTDGLIDELKIDERWVRIRRPTIVVGGELTMDQLEVTYNKGTGISEAPLQMKSNCGSLVIDDFGRQRMEVDELLNRWIVPLEERIDFLNLPSGKKMQVPFDQLIVFSTNLEPRDLVDEAFLRRIPYKIEVVDPTEGEFRHLMKMMCTELKIEYVEPIVDYLLAEHYAKAARNFRACHPRDLLMQIRNFCRYQQIEAKLTREAFDFAVENYFAVM